MRTAVMRQGVIVRSCTDEMQNILVSIDTSITFQESVSGNAYFL